MTMDAMQDRNLKMLNVVPTLCNFAWVWESWMVCTNKNIKIFKR
jgi:hypothetical protein